jgi:hypothetical protein
MDGYSQSEMVKQEESIQLSHSKSHHVEDSSPRDKMTEKWDKSINNIEKSRVTREIPKIVSHRKENPGSPGIPVKTGHRLEVGLIFPMV